MHVFVIFTADCRYVNSPPDFGAELQEREGIGLLEMNFSVEDSLLLGLLISGSLGAQVLDGAELTGHGTRLGGRTAGSLARPQQDAFRLFVDVDRRSDT